MLNINFPFHYSDAGRTAVTNDEDHIRDMIEQLLFTSQGERVNRPDFGSGLMQLVFEPNSPELAATLQATMQAALQQWLGDVIEIQTLQVTSIDSTLRVVLQYKIKPTGEVRIETFERSGVR